jgi:hypothetical protein
MGEMESALTVHTSSGISDALNSLLSELEETTSNPWQKEG